MKKIYVLTVCALMCVLAGAQEAGHNLTRFTSFEFGFPILHHEGNFYDLEEDYQFDFTSTGFSFDCSMHFVDESHWGFAFLAKLGLQYLESTMAMSSYASTKDALGDNEVDFEGFGSYLKFGFGKAFEGTSFAIIPTIGVGFNFGLFRTSSYFTDTYYDEDNGYYVADKNAASGYNFSMDVFLNIFAAYMITEDFGISASLEVARDIFCYGNIDGDTFSMDDAKFSYVPSIGFCVRL